MGRRVALSPAALVARFGSERGLLLAVRHTGGRDARSGCSGRGRGRRARAVLERAADRVQLPPGADVAALADRLHALLRLARQPLTE